MNFKKMLQSASVAPLALNARFGLEREGQRVTLQGKLAQTNHPKKLGNRNYHPYIQTDFAETQLELITPVTDSPAELMDWLAALHDVAYRSLPENEALWPLSMPPALPENESEIKLAELDAFEDVLYRRYLAREYGRRKQMVSGIHFNFEFGQPLIQALFAQQSELSLQDFQTEVYMKVARNYLRYHWLLTYLYGAAPISEANYFTQEERPKEPLRSIRNSKYGYRNHDDVSVSYESLTRYLSDIEQLVENGQLSEDKEYYAPLRLRGGKRVQDLKDCGIRYIELRDIDLQPFERYGFSAKQAQFLQVFLLLMLWLPEEEAADTWVTKGALKNDEVALEHPYATKTAYEKEGRWLLEEMANLIKELNLPLPAEFLDWSKDCLANPRKTMAAQLLAQSETSSQQAVASELVQKNHQQAWAKPYQLAGFTDMELSTQILLFDAIQKGVKARILDQSDQFLQLDFANRREYVKNANMTSKDSYVVPLMMANKTVTKKVLHQAGFCVPAGGEYGDITSALQSFSQFQNRAIVVKPKSTNYGLGISIFKEAPNFDTFKQAVEIAFAEDEAILVEEFLPGTEYRFFVLNGQVEAIMQRVPANVVGDGKHTIEELVATKNQDPLRGTHHRAPLELIQLGSIEELMLAEQGYRFDSVVDKGITVYLRENSNVSTGGDSIDMTDEINQDYKDVAVAAVKALGAKISGIDLIIPNSKIPAKTPGAYGIIEANFNPAMHMHVYPYQGKSRRLTLAVLEFLFPELKA